MSRAWLFRTGRSYWSRHAVRCRAHEEAGEEGLLRFGKSKSHRPDLRQFIQVLGTLDPAGIPLTTSTFGLTWDSNGNAEGTVYAISYSTGPDTAVCSRNPDTTIQQAVTASTHAVVGGLTPSTTYWLVVCNPVFGGGGNCNTPVLAATGELGQGFEADPRFVDCGGPGPVPVAGSGWAIASDPGGNIWEVAVDSSGVVSLAKHDSNGGFLASTILPGAGEDAGWTIRFDGSGDAYAVGATAGAGPSATDLAVYRVAASGDMLVSSRAFDSGYSNNDFAFDTAGNIWITGAVQTAGPPDFEGEVVLETALWKYDLVSDTLSLAAAYASGGGFDVGAGIARDAAGALWVSGYSMNPSTSAPARLDHMLLKFDPAGTELLAGPFLRPAYLAGPDDAMQSSIIVGESGLYISAGRVNSAGNADLGFLKYDYEGNLIFEQAWHSASGAHEVPARMGFYDGDVLIAGLTGDLQGNDSLALWRFGTGGGFKFAKTAAGVGPARGLAVIGSEIWLAVESSPSPYRFQGGPDLAGAPGLDGQADTAPPVTEIVVIGTAAVAGGVLEVQKGSSFTLVAFDPVVGGLASGVASINYLVDLDPSDPACELPRDPQAPPGTCENSVYEGPFQLSLGTHTIYFASTDNTRNEEAVHIASVTVYALNIDTTPPAVAIDITTGPIGIPFTITGTGFGAYGGANTRVKFGATAAALALWNDTTIKGDVPGISTGAYPVVVEIQHPSSTTVFDAGIFTVTLPEVFSVTPATSPVGVPFTITGTSFGPYDGANTRVKFDGAAAPLSLWTDAEIKGTVPGVSTGTKALVVELVSGAGQVFPVLQRREIPCVACVSDAICGTLAGFLGGSDSVTRQYAGEAVAEKSALEKFRAANGTATANGTPSRPRHLSGSSLTATARKTDQNTATTATANSKNIHLKSGPKLSEGLGDPYYAKRISPSSGTRPFFARHCGVGFQ